MKIINNIEQYSDERRKKISEALKGHKAWNKTHGMDGTSIYKTWIGLKARCYNKNDKDYKNYGGRGIKVCKRWKNSFENFYNDMGDKPKGMSIDRIDNNGNYEPSNCRWATIEQQNNNKRNNHLLTYNGKTQTITQWSREIKVPVSTLQCRLLRGWSKEKTLKYKK